VNYSSHQNNGMSIPTSQFRLRLIEVILGELQNANHDFCILRNSEAIIDNFPDGDVDILVRGGYLNLRKILDQLRSEQIRLGFKIYSVVWHANISVNVYIATKIDSEIKIINLEFFQDVFVYKKRKLVSEKFAYLNVDNVLDTKEVRNGYYICSEQYETVHKLIEILFNSKEKYIAGVIEQTTRFRDDFKFNCILNEVLGEVAKTEFNLNYKQLSDINTRTRLCHEVQSYFELNKRYSKRKSILRNVFSLYQHIVQYVAPPGKLCIALGTDGSGKTTLCDNFKKKHSRSFAGVERIHLGNRPIFLPSLKGEKLQSVANQLSASRSVNSHYYALGGSRVSIYQSFRFFYITIDYICHYLFVIRPLLSRGGFLLSERYFTDYVIIPERYFPAAPRWLKYFCNRLVPNSDIVIPILVDPNIIEARKKEMPSLLIQHEYRQYLDFTNKTVLISVNNNVSAELAGREFERIVFKSLCQ
jgi:thymidylate kinase